MRAYPRDGNEDRNAAKHDALLRVPYSAVTMARQDWTDALISFKGSDISPNPYVVSVKLNQSLIINKQNTDHYGETVKEYIMYSPECLVLLFFRRKLHEHADAGKGLDIVFEEHVIGTFTSPDECSNCAYEKG